MRSREQPVQSEWRLDAASENIRKGTAVLLPDGSVFHTKEEGFAKITLVGFFIE